MQQGHFDLEGRLVAQAPEAGQPRVAWVPTEQVLLLSVRVPGRQWRRALPYAVEPWLATALEENHILPLKRESDGQVHCAVVAKARLARWQAELETANWADAWLVPDCFQVPEDQAGWQIHTAEGRMLVRTGPWSGFAGDEVACEVIRSQADTHWQERAPVLPSVPLLRVLDLNRSTSHRQGLSGIIQQGIWLGGALLLLLGLYLGQMVWETHRMNAQAAAYRTQTEALFHKLFPDVRRLVNVRAQTKAQLAERIQVDMTPPRWARVLNKVAQVQGTVLKLDMDASGMRLTVSLPDEADAKALAQALNARIQRRMSTEGQQEVTYVVPN